MFSSDFEVDILSTPSRMPAAQNSEFLPRPDVGLSTQGNHREFGGFFPSPDDKPRHSQQAFSGSGSVCALPSL